ncbi:MAG: gamma carbonic anhydrase family protein [Firmicutes bacterium]|nr:gamma carbonic anhydrase family protein [Bacillota bacterium]
MMIRSLAGKEPVMGKGVFVADNAVIVGDVALADGVSVWFGAVLRGDIEPIRIGQDSNIQDGAIMHTDEGYPVELGRRVTVGHAAIIHGAAVEDDVLIGMGATLLSGSRIGQGAVVAAGALVPERATIPPGVLAMGVPARVVRPLTPEERERVARGVTNYCRRRDLYLAHGFGQPHPGRS